MKMNISLDTLARAVKLAARAVPAKIVFPPTDMLRLYAVAEDDTLRVQATDLETSIEMCVTGSVSEGGCVLVDAARLAGFLASLSGGTAEISSSESRLTVRVGNAKTTLALGDPENFPHWPELPDPTLTLPAAGLRTALAAVLPAMARDSLVRPVLSGMGFQVRDETLSLTAADGFRLATTTLALLEPLEWPALVASGPGLRHVMALLDGCGDLASVHLARPEKGNVLAFLTEAGTVVVRLIDSQYPDFERVIPQQPAETVTVAATTLADGIKVVRPFSRENSQILRLHATPESTLRLTCRDEVGDGVIDLPAEATGEAQVAVNAAYLLDAVAAFAGGDVRLGISEASPILLTAAGSPTRCMLMPMHISRDVPEPVREEVAVA